MIMTDRVSTAAEIHKTADTTGRHECIVGFRQEIGYNSGYLSHTCYVVLVYSFMGEITVCQKLDFP